MGTGPASLIDELEALVRRILFTNGLFGQLMIAYYRNGQQSDALRAYARGRDALVEDLGLDPGPAAATTYTSGSFARTDRR